MIAQAYTDGMTRIAIGCVPENRAVHVRYFGPQHGERQWWDMLPPPSDVYALLVRAVIEATTFKSGVDPVGVIRAEINKTKLDIQVVLRSWFDLELSWDK